MYVNKKLFLLLVECLMTVVCKGEYNHLDKKSSDVRSDYKSADKYSCEKELRECRHTSDEMLSRRIVNMLLSRIDFKEGSSWFNGRAVLVGTASEFETLKNFGLGVSTLREVAPILDDVIKPTGFDEVDECGSCLQSLTFQLFNFIDTYKQYILSMGVILYFFLTLSSTKFNFRTIFFVVSFYIFFVIFGKTWLEVEQEENMKEVPIHCRPDEMRRTDEATAPIWSAEDCEKHDAVMDGLQILKVAIFRTLDRLCGEFMALSINIAFTIIKLLTECLRRLGVLIVGFLSECSMTTLFTLSLVLYGFYFYHSRCSIRHWVPRQSLNEDVFSDNPNRTRNRRRKRSYEMLW